MKNSFRNPWTSVAGSAALIGILAASLASIQGQGQTVPNVAAPPAIPIPNTALSQGQTWTPTQWGTGFAEKKDVIVFSVSTSASSAVTMTTNGAVAGPTNVGSIPTSTAVEYSAQCIIIDRTNRKANTYTFGPSAISNIAGTVAVGAGNPAGVAGPTLNAGLTLGAVPTIVADNTNKGWAIAFTPPAANTDSVYGQCTLELLVVN